MWGSITFGEEQPHYQKKAQVISPTARGALFSARTTPQPAEPRGTLAEPWWNPCGTLPQGRPGPPRSLSGLRPQSFQLLRRKKRRGFINPGLPLPKRKKKKTWAAGSIGWTERPLRPMRGPCGALSSACVQGEARHAHVEGHFVMFLRRDRLLCCHRKGGSKPMGSRCGWGRCTTHLCCHLRGGGQNRFGIPFWLDCVNSPPILEPVLVVGLGCSLRVRDFDPWPERRLRLIGVVFDDRGMEVYIGLAGFCFRAV